VYTCVYLEAVLYVYYRVHSRALGFGVRIPEADCTDSDLVMLTDFREVTQLLCASISSSIKDEGFNELIKA
jgi:hypothetical protein